MFSFLTRRKTRSYHRRQVEDESTGGGFGFGSIFNMLAELSPETKKGIFIITLFLLGALSVLGLLDLSGKFGQLTNSGLAMALGNIRWLVPVLLGAWIFCLLNEEKYPIRLINYFGVCLLLCGLAGIFHLSFDSWMALEAAKAGHGGGYLGAAVSLPLLRGMGYWGALVVLVAVLLIGILLALETSIYGILWPLKVINYIYLKLKDWHYYRKMRHQEQLLSQTEEDTYEEESAEVAVAPAAENFVEEEPEEIEEEAPGFVKTEIKMGFSGVAAELPEVKNKKYGPLDIPIGLMNSKVGKATAGDIKNSQEVIRRTLSNFGIPVEMGDVNIGPTVTQYTMRPVDGVRLSKITTLNADLALALAAHPIRIEAPIPGKSLVGIEVPNVISAKVTMGEMLLSKEYKARTNNLHIALGKDVSGKAIFAQLDKMPHLLVAGATGSGKSVCVNSIIISLMYQNSPDELKFILVDPKRVELPLYNNIPYLLTPVITDVKKTIGALKWSITEMERRFELLAKFGNRNIGSYNQTHADKMPYIVIIIDELADLMASAANDMEAGIVRLAQMSRAVGIHLILATQRPSTEVITGLIKANIPARASFSVASSIDSRTILDGSGAEKLVGRGDMLYLGPEYSKPKRIQGVFVSDKEVSDLIRFIKSQGEAEYVEALTASGSSSYGGSSGGGGFGGDSDEPLINEAIDVIRESGKASASLLQRRLKLGYARAARILDILEEKGIIGPSDGAKAREIFLDKLGGVNALEFSAREHNLTGELRPISETIKARVNFDDEEEEPSFTAFSRGQEIPETDLNESEDDDQVEEPEEELPTFFDRDIEVDALVEPEIITETNTEELADQEMADAIETEAELLAEAEAALASETEAEEAEEEIEVITAAAEEEEEEVPAKPKKSHRDFFSNDEWT